jgi:hypothetical protein
MSTSSLFNQYFEQAAKRAAQNRTPGATLGGPADPLKSYSLLNQTAAQTPESEMESGWSLGQSLIDILSTGSYAGAGLGKGIGEAAQKIQQGDLFGGIGSVLAGPGQGIAERRTWSDNLKDLGVEEGPASGFGLAMAYSWWSNWCWNKRNNPWCSFCSWCDKSWRYLLKASFRRSFKEIS